MSAMRKKDDDDDGEGGSSKGPPWTEFECPECTATNNYSDGFTIGDDLTCMYCGVPFEVRATESGYKLRNST